MSAGHPPRPLCPEAQRHIPSTAGQLGDSLAKPPADTDTGTAAASPSSEPWKSMALGESSGQLERGMQGGETCRERSSRSSILLQHPSPAFCSSILLQHSLQYPTLASCSARPVPSHCPGRRMETVCSLIPHMIHIHSQLIPCTFWVGKGFSHFSPLTNMGATFHPWGLSPTCSLDQFAKPKS